MKKVELELRKEKFMKAFDRLKQAVESASNDLERDGVIQRFEFTIELLWKAIKAVLEYNKIECYSPRDCIKSAFRHGIIDDDEIILDMLDDRNASSHIYDEKEAEKIFKRIKSVYIKSLENIMKKISGS